MVKGSEDKYRSYYAQPHGRQTRREDGSSQQPAKSSSNPSSVKPSSSRSPEESSSKRRSSIEPGAVKNGSISSKASSASSFTNGLVAMASAPLRENGRYQNHDNRGNKDGSRSSLTNSNSTSDTKNDGAKASRLTAHAIKSIKIKKEETIQKLMAQFYAVFGPWIEETFGVECYDDGEYRNHGDSSSNKNSSSGSTGSANGSSSSRNSRKRPQRSNSDDENDEPGNSDDEDDRDKRNDKKRVKRDDEKPNGPRMACPFYKNDPNSSHHHRLCRGPGWETYPRLKEHIKRCHSPPENMCNRCLRSHSSHKALEAHQRSDPPCKVRNDKKKRFVLTNDQFTELQKRTRGLDNSDKWNAMYQIIFPGQKLPYSPYTGEEPSEANELGEFMASEIPWWLYNIMGSELDELNQGFESQMKQRISEMLPSLIKDCLKRFQDNRKQISRGEGSTSSHGGGTGTSKGNDLKSSHQQTGNMASRAPSRSHDINTGCGNSLASAGGGISSMPNGDITSPMFSDPTAFRDIANQFLDEGYELAYPVADASNGGTTYEPFYYSNDNSNTTN